MTQELSSHWGNPPKRVIRNFTGREATLSQLRSVVSSVEALTQEDKQRLARLINESIPLNGATEWISRVRRLLENEAVTVDDMVVSGQYILIFSDAESPQLENLNRLAAKAKRVGINRLSPAQILVLVLIWLLVIGIPIIQQELPRDAQSIVVDEVGTIGAGLAITQMIIDKREHK